MLNHSHHLFDLVGVMRIVLGRGGQKLFHQNIVDLFCFHALKGQVQMPDGLLDSPPVGFSSLGQEIANEPPGVMIDRPFQVGTCPWQIMLK